MGKELGHAPTTLSAALTLGCDRGRAIRYACRQATFIAAARPWAIALRTRSAGAPVGPVPRRICLAGHAVGKTEFRAIAKFMADFDTDHLATLLGERHACLRDLCELGRRQLNLIAVGDLSELLNLLAIKQRLLSGLHTVERQLDPFRGQQSETRRWSSPQQRAACARLKAECETFLSTIVTQEQTSESQLCARRDEVSLRLQGVPAAATARGAYTADAAMPSQFDLSCEI